MDKQAIADCSFSSEDDVEDTTFKAKIEEIMQGCSDYTDISKNGIFKSQQIQKTVNDQLDRQSLSIALRLPKC